MALFFLYRSEREHGSWRLGERARQRYPAPLQGDRGAAAAGRREPGAGRRPRRARCRTTVAELLTQRSGGNPFFLEEALRDLVERGALAKRTASGSWPSDRGRARDPGARPGRPAGPARPARPGDARGALARSSHRPDVRHSAPREARSARAAHAGAHRAPAARPHLRGAPPAESRSIASATGSCRRSPTRASSSRRAKKLHKRVGEALEEIYSESPEEAYALLARHFSEADDPEKAVEYLLKAGDAARAIYADQEALEHYRKARAFLGADRRRASRPRHALQDGSHLSPRLRLRECGGDVRRGVLLPRRRGDAARADRAPRDGGLEARRRRPGPRLLDGGPEDHGAALPGLLMIDGELNVLPVDGGQHARLERRAQLPLPPPRRRALERRRAADGGRLRLCVDAHARARDPHRVPDGGRRDRRGPRRPHARDHAARAAQLLPLRPRLALGVPLAPAQLRGSSGRTGTGPRTSSPTARSCWPSSTTSTRS